MLVCLVHGYILFLKLRHMCDEMVKINPAADSPIELHALVSAVCVCVCVCVFCLHHACVCSRR